jgi:hypothetical protein
MVLFDVREKTRKLALKSEVCTKHDAEYRPFANKCNSMFVTFSCLTSFVSYG